MFEYETLLPICQTVAATAIIVYQQKLGNQQDKKKRGRQSPDRTRAVELVVTPGVNPERSILSTRSGLTPSSSRAQKVNAPKRVTFFDFKGLMAPVFTCFSDDGTYKLLVDHVDTYAAWLKEHKIGGVLVNSISGEGPALGIMERKRNAEAWWAAASKHNLILMVQVGGAPLPDVLELAAHAEDLGAHAVLCLPELFYKPLNINQLVGYLRIVAKHCNSRPFFYYHVPLYTGLRFNLRDMCNRAEEVIPNFYGIQYSDYDLGGGEECFSDRRVVMLGNGRMLASGLLLGFQSAMVTFLNVQPWIGWSIYNAIQNNEMKLAQEQQLKVNGIANTYTDGKGRDGWVNAMKKWFNDEAFKKNGAGFSVGPARKFN